MHELAVTEHMLDLVLKEAERHNAKKVNGIKLVVGELSGIDEECIRFYFDILSENTPACGAWIQVRYEKAEFKCTRCGEGFERKGFSHTCPACGGLGVLVNKGMGLYIDSIEVEQFGDKGD